MYNEMFDLRIFTDPKVGQEFKKLGFDQYVRVDKGKGTHVWDGQRIIRKTDWKKAAKRIAREGAGVLLLIGGIAAFQAAAEVICRVVGC